MCRSETEAVSNNNSIIVIQFNQQATEVEVESLVTSAGKVWSDKFIHREIYHVEKPYSRHMAIFN